MSCDRDERVCVRLQSTLVEFPVSVQWPVCNVEQIVTYTAVGPPVPPPQRTHRRPGGCVCLPEPTASPGGTVTPTSSQQTAVWVRVSCNGREAA